MLAEQLRAGDAAGVSLHLGEGVVVDMQGGQAGHGGAQEHHGGQGDRHGAAGDPGADARPQPGLLAPGLEVTGDARPERGPPGDQEQRGQEGDLGEQGGDDADGAYRAQAVQGGRLRRQQADHGAGDGAGGGQQGGQGRSQRGGHRVLGGGVAAQLLPVTVDEQQRVVGGRAQDQHPQDRGRQRADGEPGVGEPVRGGLGDDDGPERAEQRQQPQEGAAVDNDEDDHDDHEGGEQQGVLGTAADAAVGVHRGRSGHRDLQASARSAGPLTAWRMACTAAVSVLVSLGGRGGDLRGERIGLPVSRPLRPAGSAESLDMPAKACHRAAGRGDRRQVRGRQAAAAGEHHCRRVDVRLPRRLLELDNPRGRRRGRQVGRGGAVGHAGQAAGQRVEGHENEHPGDQHRPAQPAQRGR